MAETAWSRLTARGKARLKKSGVQPASYNAYARKSKAQRAKVNRDEFVRGKTRQQLAQKTRRATKRDKRKQAVDHILRVLRGKSKKQPRTKSIQRGVDMMTDAEVDEALTADYNFIAARAMRPMDPIRGKNPWWYG